MTDHTGAGEATPDPAATAVRRLIDEVWNGGRLDLLADLYADPFDHDGRPGSVEELLEWHRADAVTWADTRYDIVRVVSDGEQVAVRWRASARQIGPWGPVQATGRTVTWQGAHFFRVDGGRIVAVVSVADGLGKALELGVQMVPPHVSP